MNTSSDQSFVYRGCSFICSVEPADNGLFRPHVLYRYGIQGLERFVLPEDTEPYASEAEAQRHAQQEAMRWVHDRTGDGRGQF